MNVDFKSITIFLHEKGLKPHEIQSEIDSVFGKNSYSYQAITKTLRKISFTPSQPDNEKIDENFVYQQKISIIQKTLEDFPFSSLKQIAEETNIPKTTVYRIVRKELGYVLKHLKWIPHCLTSSQKLCRIRLSKNLFPVLQEADRTNYQLFMTGDESWFYLTTDHETQWLPLSKIPSKRAKKMIGSKKYMLTIFWNPKGFQLVKILPDDTTFNDDYFITEILEPIFEMTADLIKESGKKMILHFDNARPHVSKKVLEYMDSHGMDRAPQPPYSPDIAPSDFYLFGYVKGLLAGRTFQSADELLSAVTEILNEISEKTLLRVFKEWEERLNQVIILNGDYIE